jgi:gas vesicle protein
MSGPSLMGLAVGLGAGLAAGLLAAPMRGRDLRASLRSRADRARERGARLVGEGKRAVQRGPAAETAPATLTATLGDIANTYPGAEPPTEAQP